MVDQQSVREQDLIRLKTNGYPASFDSDVSDGYLKLENVPLDTLRKSAEELQILDLKVYFRGRIRNIRSASKKLYFIDASTCDHSIQIMASEQKYRGNIPRDYQNNLDSGRLNPCEYDNLARVCLDAFGRQSFSNTLPSIRVGDHISVKGVLGRTKNGELSIFAETIELVSVCWHIPPEKLEDPEIRFRNRYLDMICNPEVANIFRKRHQVIKSLRNFLDNLDFVEVTTPTLGTNVGGAIAKPFITESNDFNMKMYMRVSPELYLKQLIIGGFEKIYEIGQQFRNETSDKTHNPEFTSMEMYWAGVDYNFLMEVCENLISEIVKTVNNGSLIVEYDSQKIDFTPPYRRFDMIQELNSRSGLQIPKDLKSEETRKYLDGACVRFDVGCTAPRTTSRLLDKLVGHFVEVDCINPTFVMHHPIEMSPLAREHRSIPGVTERFELFVNKMELANAYSELNDPRIQKSRFEAQAVDRANGDQEAMMTDYEFIQALEYGLPPTGGFGLGIDRLVMFLTNQTSIREVLPFPTMRPL